MQLKSFFLDLNKPVSITRKFPFIPIEWQAEFHNLTLYNQFQRLEVSSVATLFFPIFIIIISMIIRFLGGDTIAEDLPPFVFWIVLLNHSQLMIISLLVIFHNRQRNYQHTNSITLTSKRIFALYMAGLFIFFVIMSLALWIAVGVNTTFIIGLYSYVVLFFSPNRIHLLAYITYCLGYFLVVAFFPKPFPYMFNAIVSGFVAPLVGWAMGEIIYEGQLRNFLSQKYLEEQAHELSVANTNIIELNERLKGENIRMATELNIARELQSIILPKREELLRIAFLDVAAFMSPASEVGGDYFDVLVSSKKEKLTLAIADVTGHGLESGIFTIMVQSAVRMLHNLDNSPLAHSINVLNQLLFDNAQRMGSDKSMTFALLNYDRGTVKLCGQHEEVILVNSQGILQRIDTINLGFPLGLEADISSFLAETEFVLTSGDVLILYTDGITEAVNPQNQLYGIDRLCAVIHTNHHRSAEEIRQSITEDLMNFVQNATIFDDITLVIMKQW